jgi:tetratricopeptide (TPR) repeat protein
MTKLLALQSVLAIAALAATDLEIARDRQDKAALQTALAQLSKTAEQNQKDASAQYRLALAQSYLSEVAFETKDKALAQSAAETGIRAAEKAVALQGNVAEHHRILGTLCGQVIPANILLALKYGKCATESINKALELDPKSSPAWLSRGVGNYYLPASFGGGVELAVRDFEKAVETNPRSAEAYLWKGIALRKLNRNAEARASIQKSLELNPSRVWAKQQLEKTPAQ